MRRPLRRSALLFAWLYSLIAIPGLACDCPPKRSVQDELASMTAVFSGKIVQMHWFDKEVQGFHGKRMQKAIIIVTVQVNKIWKGDVPREVEVETPDPEENNCGVDFKKEQEYLIYAFKKQRLETDVCSRTKLSSAASEDISALGSGREP